MTLEEQIQYWVDIAESDVSVAKELLEKERFIYCLFFGHLFLEKILKAHYVKDTNEVPPKIHDLVKLIRKTKIDYSPELIEFLNRVNDFQIESRYPDYKTQLYKTLDKKYTEENFDKILEVYQWLKSQL
ncbi:MAG: HEPN domain-containing protein [Bacteroidota bacterium]